MTDLCGCSRPLTGGALCTYCGDELTQLAAELPAMIGLLYDHMGGQVRFNASTGGGRSQKSTKDEHGDTSIETGLDLPSNATTASSLLKSYLRRTTRLLMDAGAAHPIRLPADELNPMARFLYTHLDTLRRLPDVYDLKEELRRLTARLMRLVDKPVERLYAGVCSNPTDKGDCPEDLYAFHGSKVIVCHKCGHRHAAEDRQRTMRAVAEEMHLTAKEIRAIVPTLMGTPLNPATFRKWKSRGKISVVGQLPGTEEDLFRCGDVIALCKASEEPEAKAG